MFSVKNDNTCGGDCNLHISALEERIIILERKIRRIEFSLAFDDFQKPPVNAVSTQKL